MLNIAASCGEPGGNVETADKGRASLVLALELLATYGNPEATPQDTMLPLGGAVLGTIYSIRSMPDGRFAVLDNAFKKIVIFSTAGDVVRVIGKGHGRGPGEFLEPTALDIDERGRIAVFDYSLNRVTVFDTMGTVVATTNTPRAKDIALVNDTIVGSYMPAKEFLIWKLPMGSSRAHGSIPLETMDTAFNPRGVGRLARDQNGTPIVAHPRPGFWSVLAQGVAAERAGLDLFPEGGYKVWEGVPIPLAECFGIATLSTRHLGLALNIWNQGSRSDQPAITAQQLAIFDRLEGHILGVVDLGSDKITAITGAPAQGEILVTRYDPYPAVQRFAVRGLSVN